MKILDIEIVNYRNIDHLKIDFRTGITGLLGHNGSGKSSFLSAFCFVNTGLVLGDDNKSDLMRWGEKKGYVKERFQANNKTYVIKRNIQGSVVDLREEGAPRAAFSSREDIDSFMLSLIDLHPRLFDKVIFIEQEGLDSLLKATHSKRVDFFNDLFDATVAEKLRGLIQGYIQRIPVYPDYEQEKDECYKLIAEDRTLRAGKVASVTRLQEGLDATPDIQTLIEQAAKPSVKDIENEVKVKEELIEQHRVTANALKDVMLPVFITAEREGLYQQYKMMKAKEENVKAAEDKVNSMTYPKQEKFIGPDPEATRADLKAEEHNLTEKLKLCKMGKCPTCGHTYKGVDRDKLIKKQDKNKEKMITVLSYINTLKEITTAKTDLTLYQEDLKRFMATLPPDVLAFNEQSYLEDKETIAKQPMQIDEYRRKETQAVSAEASIIQLNRDIAEIRKKDVISDEDRAKYKEMLETYKAVQDQLNVTNNEIGSIDTRIKMREDRIQAILLEEQKAEKNKKLLNILNKCRETLHRDCLPQVRVSAGLSYINVKLSEWLDHFNVPFTMRVDDNCDFIISVEGSEHPYKALSVGQRKVAAIAFRMAVAEIFGGSMGVLSLDEPTAYMDIDAKNSLVGILNKAASRALSKDMYVFMSTHETMFINAFTNTYNMETKKYENVI